MMILMFCKEEMAQQKIQNIVQYYDDYNAP